MNTLTKLSYQGYIFAMLFITSRAPLSPLALAFCAALVTTTGCPKPSAIKVPPPPPGDMLRYLAKANDKLTGKVNVRFEDGDLGVKKPTVYAFMFKEERQVQSVDGTGNMNYTASFFDVEPVGDTPKDKKAGEQLARALQTVKIAYTMSPRGDVTNFDVKVPDDIKESKEGKQMERQLGYVRLIAQWVYGADRGPQFDPGHIEAGKGWPIRASIPTPTGGSKNWDMTCTYAKREQGIAYINMEGKVSGENQGTKLSGEVKGELRLRIGEGRLTYHDIDTTSTFRAGDQSSGGHQVHIHVTWEAEQAAVPAGDGTAVMP
jgi:hypothetical protein